MIIVLSLSQRVSPGKGLSHRVLEFFPVHQFTLLWRQNLFSDYATLNRFWLLWILFWLCNWTVVISIQITIIQMVSWPTKRFFIILRDMMLFCVFRREQWSSFSSTTKGLRTATIIVHFVARPSTVLGCQKSIFKYTCGHLSQDFVGTTSARCYKHADASL